MLVLSRQRDETIMIGDNIEITVVDIRGDKVRLGITAPKEIPVHRKEVWESMLPYLDLILYDLKETDPEHHRHWTGVSNELVLENLRRLAGSGKPVIVRRPVIPGYNDGVETIHDLGRFVRELGTIEEIDLLPYHRLGQGKYERLGQEYALGDEASLEGKDVEGLREILESYGFRVKIGG